MKSGGAPAGRVLVVGGYGAVGAVVTATLAEWFPGLVVPGGRDEVRARRLGGVRVDVADPDGFVQALDELGELSLDLQPKLLRVLEQRELRRVGGSKTLKVDLRVVAATRKNSFNVYMYEQTIPGGITPAAFRAQYIVDVSSVINEKMDSIRAHWTQMKRNGDWWLEGIRGRAMYRGYQIQTQYAEAFEIIKIKDDTNLFAAERAIVRATAPKELSEAVA